MCMSMMPMALLIADVCMYVAYANGKCVCIYVMIMCAYTKLHDRNVYIAQVPYKHPCFDWIW